MANDTLGRLKTVGGLQKDRAGRTTRYQHDAIGRVTNVIDNAGARGAREEQEEQGRSKRSKGQVSTFNIE